MIFTLTLNPALDRELAIEMFRYDSVVTAVASRVDPGGKGFNVSRALTALGSESRAYGFAGGLTGKMLEKALAVQGITTTLTPIAGETRTNTSIVTASGGHYLKVNEPGPVISDDEAAALVEAVSAAVTPGGWWVLAGSLPPGLTPGFYAHLIGIIHAGGGRVILDASGEALRLGCTAGPDLVKPNRDEAAVLTSLPVEPGGDDFAPVFARIREMGARDILLSLGRDGAVYAVDDRIIHASPPRITPRNPIGAGDAMVAGAVMALAGGLPPADVLRWGVACGSAAASLAGTDFAPRDVVVSLLEGVTLRE